MKKSENKADNILIAVFSCVMAPVISRLINLVCGQETIWSTEMILLVYTSSIIGYVISWKLYSHFEKTKLYQKGFRLGDADNVKFVIWVFPVVLSLNNGSIYATVLLIIISLLAVFIVAKDIKNIDFSKITLLVIGLMTLCSIIVYTIYPNWWFWLMIILAAFMMALIRDSFVIIIRRIKQ